MTYLCKTAEFYAVICFHFKINTMKFILSLLILFFAFSGTELLAQKKFYRLPEGMKAGHDYEPGVIIARLKPERTQNEEIALRDLLQKSAFNNVKLAFPNAVKFEANKRIVSKTFSLSDFLEFNMPAVTDLEKAVNELLQTGAFLYAEPAVIYHTLYTPNDPLRESQYYLNMVKAYQAWDLHKGDSNVVIGIVDSGFDFKHPDLKNKFKYNQADPIDGIDNDNDGYIDNHRGWDFASGSSSSPGQDNDPQVTAGSDHGIQVAGCAAADTDNNEGIAAVGFNCKILATKHGADNGGTGLFRSWEGILYTAMKGAKVINCSFGGTFASSFVQDIITKAVFDYDAVVIAAAGNNGSAELFYPASYDYVLSVGASDAGDFKSGFSNFGYKVDITAPGSVIFTTHHSERTVYRNTQGTSFSSPIVAGAAGLVRSKYPELSALEVAELLRATADTAFYTTNSSASVYHTMGRGRLDVFRALSENPPSLRILAADGLNEAGQAIIQNERGYIYLKLKNYLSDTKDDMTATLTALSADVVLETKTVKLGKVKRGQEIELGKDGFKIRLNRMAQDKEIWFKIQYSQNGFTDYEYFSLTLNKSFIVIDVNRIRTSVDSRGMMAFHNDNRTLGESFKLDNSIGKLFELGLIMGQSKSLLSNATRPAENDKAWDKDFATLKQIRETTAPEGVQFYWEGEFNDANAAARRVNARIKHSIMAWNMAGNDNYIIADYKLYYSGGRKLDNFHIGLFADWDISNNGQLDYADWDDEGHFGYVYDGKKEFYVGIKMLNGEKYNYYAINNNQNSNDTPFGLYDGFTYEEKFLSISSKLDFLSAGYNSAGADVSHAVGYGPHELDRGDSLRVGFAIMAGKTLDELKTAAKNAEEKYKTIKERLENPLSVVDLLKADEWAVFPNPSNDYVNFRFNEVVGGNLEATLADISGREVLHQNFSAIQNDFRLDVSQIPSGVYFLNVKSGNKAGTKSVVIVR
jgi:hypothetical protein